MGKHHILCIHGIGKHDNDWVRTEKEDGESFEELFKKLYKEYMPNNSFDNEVQLHSIHYDDEINKIFASWEEYSNNLKEGLSSSILLNEVEWFTNR